MPTTNNSTEKVDEKTKDFKEGLVDPHSDKPTTLRRVRQLTGKGEWSEVDKIRAVAVYLEIGTLTKTSDMTGVPVETLKNWKYSPWWNEVKSKIMGEQDEEMSARFTKIVKKAQKEVIDRIDKGDWIVLKDGRKDRIPLKAKDMQYVINSSIDKRQILNDRPTSRTENISMKEKLNRISEEFAKFAKAKQINQEPNEENDTTRPE